ncbi:MAG: peptidoglycan-associated lipoprotein Pal [Pseudomonadota bacterium]|jgi:peptidoglycan-associated lipoprotein|uniref:Peptidoglycan-associated lipoprotein n=1 Tax=Actibacterium naphthalenivorans TaxID=1614693 RepID=A0A840C694_9RHOB|nr:MULTISPECIES: peptidoglycan-associated lipoprotein Pal [Actibacterium]ALG89714.1 membrane protein [Actibacterium sp. EMB200-NS6]KGB80422.1 membrane protein [Rhodovulum sp. NI22]MBB4020600.1 peptidoglycan-associated lipoprotein [Actibacterium naphthalenivorans]MDY6858525.1 peptidoglycan-associated lipoprotein Pal [Pseudomonadota bacterium]|tara:strand:- start:779 stop:1288 length:510 start_codon:yes stop_codon:yes gene_type:complete
MKTVSKSILVVAALTLAACSDPARFDTAGAGAGTTGAAGFAGSVNDPSSVAYFEQTIGDRVHFAVDQSSLSDSALVTLAGQAEWLLTNTEYSVIVEGHADEQGTREYNLALGARRANAVQEYLVSRGVSPARVRTVSYGKERPIEICSDESCYAQNRRAVTVVTAGAGS